MDDDLAWRAAIHEAGHLVGAKRMGLPAYFPIDCGVESVVALMSGAIGESLILGDYDEVGVEVDWARVCARLERLGYFDGGDALWAWTFDLMREHEGVIVRVAAALMGTRWLDGDEIDALMLGACR
jgi:hypothetical protein